MAKLTVLSYQCEEISEDIGSIVLKEVELSDPGPGEVRVRLKACAVNFPDLLMIQGKYQFKPPLPFAPGSEAAGDIEACGPECDFKEGDKVIVNMRCGGFSEGVVVDQSQVRAIPEGMEYGPAASYQTAYLTAYVALYRRGHLRKGESLLVHGATGGVGMAAVDLGKFFRAKVIATGGRDDKLSVVKQRGADHVINYSLPNGSLGGFREEVKNLTQGNGADVVYDPVGGDVFDESMRCINIGGRLLTIGFTSGRWPNAPVNLVLIKQLSIIGVRAGEFGRVYPELGQENRETLYAMATNKDIDPHISHALPLDQAIDAMRLLEKREVVGKAIVTMNGYSFPQ